VVSPPGDEVRRAAEFRFALRRFSAASDRLVRASGLTPRRYLLLLALESAAARGHRVAIGDLVGLLLLAQSTVTGLIDRAEHAGLVARTQAAHDARVVNVDATAEGRRRFTAAFAALQGERSALALALAPLLDANGVRPQA
jgi:DNA-binding MarR family transcriptional regulator